MSDVLIAGGALVAAILAAAYGLDPGGVLILVFIVAVSVVRGFRRAV